MTAQNPDDFVISRRRKLYKFAKFRDDARCFSGDDFAKFFAGFRARDDNVSRRLVIEIGAGSALFLTELARQNPDALFIAIDRKSDRLWQGARLAAEQNLANVFYVFIEAKHIPRMFPGRDVDEIWVTFPDPLARDDYQQKRAEFSRFFHDKLRFPGDENYAKNLQNYLDKIAEFDQISRQNFADFLRKNGRERLASARYIAIYERILRADGAINFKTDNSPLFEWALVEFQKNGFLIEFLSRNLHRENDPKFAPAQIKTSYETRYDREFLPISFARFSAKK